MAELLPQTPQASEQAEARNAPQMLNQSEALFRVLSEAMPQMVWATDAEGNHLYYNRRWYDYTGQNLEESIGFGFALALHPDDTERTVEKWRGAWQGGADYEIEYRFRRFDGAYRWFVGRAEPVRDTGGSVLMWVGTCTDIDEVKQAQQELSRLYEKERVRAEREAVQAKIGAAVRSGQSPDEVQTVVARVLGQSLGADRCFFAFADTSRNALVIERDFCADGLSSVAGSYRSSDFDKSAGRFFGSGVTFASDDTQAQSELGASTRALLQQLKLCALVSVPFYDAQGKVIAALNMAMQTPRQWTSGDVALVEYAATEARAASDAARERMRERTIAQQLQEALQPPPPPSLPGLALASFYRPALSEAEVGGDFFDVFSVEKNCSALVVADLSGKGLKAARQVAVCRDMLRFAIYTGRTVADAVTTLHYTLAEHDLLEGFATLFVGMYDHAYRTITYVNGGQEPGLIWRAASRTVETLDPTGPVLGGFAAGKFTQKTVTLETGDALALFTDGLTEVGPTRRELLELPGVIDYFAACCQNPRSKNDAQNLAADLMARIDAFSRGGAPDDIALLIGIVGGNNLPKETQP